RDIANALLGIPEPPPPIPIRPPPPPTVVEADVAPAPALATVPFDLVAERGDPTTSDVRDGAGPLDSSNAHGRLRAAATLRRKRGLGGDLRYVFTVLFGVRAARAELAVLEVEQVARRSERRRNLVTLGRTAVITELEHPALETVSERLSAVEEERAGHAGQVAAADQELTRVRRDREAKIKQHATDVAAVEAELQELGKRQEPLERELHTIKKRASSVYDALQSIDRRIAEAETSKTSMRSQRVDPASIQAEIATLRADRKAVERDEPMVAAEQDALMPRIASLEAARNDARTRRARLDDDEAKDQRRVAELLEAIGAKRKVVDRAAGDAETLRDDLLFELGEALYVDRPRQLAAQLAPVDAIDLELGTGERRVMELREILSNVDKWKLARGIAVIALIAAAIAGIVLLFVLLSA
ncbi:MAG: hypothetical protein NT062_14950, partial [Proteobacteria bacterium]|nr:hypothetical protein [Pseudomonadota bacterium]